MNSSLQRYLAAFSFFLFACCRLVHADVACNDNTCCQQAYCQQAPCCDLDATFGLSYLYWGAHAEEVGFAIENVLLNQQPPAGSTGTLKSHHTKWGSGFRLDGEVFNRCVPVGCRFQYTYFRTTSHASADSDIPGVPAVGVTTVSLLPNGNNGSSTNNGGNPFLGADSAASKWNVRVNEIGLDFEYLGWNCGGCVSLQPYVGLLGAFLDQKQSVFYKGAVINPGSSNQETFDVSVSRRSQFCGVGPRLGLEVTANLWNRLRLIGNGNMAFLVGRFRTHSTVTMPPTISDQFMDFRESVRCARPMIGGLLGFEWNEPIGCGCVFSLGVSYEFQYWWQQWHSASNLIDNLVSGEGRWGDLSIHGAVLSARVSF